MTTEAVTTTQPEAGDPFARLAEAAIAVRTHRHELSVAELAVEIERKALEGALLELDQAYMATAGVRFPAAVEAQASVALDEHPDAARTVKPSAVKRQPGHHPATSKEAQEKAERRRKVMEAMERLGGDQRAVAAELGMKANAVAMVVKFAGAGA